MLRRILSRNTGRFGAWWRAPITRKDRSLGAVVGGIGCFWIGILARASLGPMPMSLATIGWWALGSVAVGIALGIGL